ncbi:MAG: cobalamin B12-binding domain-containing protein [Candidatus Omnitrophica bacterium]|nr:cobalamin B12-binding domain-containing protein [Candidatus Omnitrophota bacterium]
MKILLLSPPRQYWPFIGEYDNFILPQHLACLASVLEKDGFEVNVLDCMASKCGWKTLAEYIKKNQPEVVACGENHALYSHEVVKVFSLVKTINSAIITIAGGTHFSVLADDYAKNRDIDFIVIGEGEITLLELMRELRSGRSNFKKIPGIAYFFDNEIVYTPHRRLIENLDELPHPAYHLMPMDAYGKSRFLFSPGGITIHHSRGCTGSCKFCAWWLQMADRREKDGKIELRPRWRTKGVAKTIEEIKILYHEYGKKCFIFVDESWNIDSLWNNDFAEQVLKEKLKINYFAFMRADCIIRDQKKGIFRKLVSSGLAHICVGIERCESDINARFNKSFGTSEITRECFSILEQYPQVFRQGTFIVGLENDSKESMMRQVKFARELKADYPAFHPITVLPGTALWNEMKEKGKLEHVNFGKYDWATPHFSTKYLSIEEVDFLIYEMNKAFATLSWLLRGLFSPYRYKRDLYIWWLLVSVKIALESLAAFINPFRRNVFSALVTPKWYDN